MHHRCLLSYCDYSHSLSSNNLSHYRNNLSILILSDNDLQYLTGTICSVYDQIDTLDVSDNDIYQVNKDESPTNKDPDTNQDTSTSSNNTDNK